MAASLTSGSLSIAANIRFTVTQTGADGAVQSDPFTNNNYAQLPSDADAFFHKGYTLSPSGTQNLDLTALTDALGNAVSFSKFYALLIQNLAIVSGRYISIGGGDIATWVGNANDVVKVGPKGCLFLSSPVDGYAITETTGDDLLITNGTANSVDIRVTIVGKA